MNNNNNNNNNNKRFFLSTTSSRFERVRAAVSQKFCLVVYVVVVVYVVALFLLFSLRRFFGRQKNNRYFIVTKIRDWNSFSSHQKALSVVVRSFVRSFANKQTKKMLKSIGSLNKRAGGAPSLPAGGGGSSDVPSSSKSSSSSSSSTAEIAKLEKRLDDILDAKSAFNGDAAICVRRFRARNDLVPMPSDAQKRSFKSRSIVTRGEDEDRETKLARTFSQTQGEAQCFGFTVCSCEKNASSSSSSSSSPRDEETTTPLFECELWLSRGRESEESGPPGSWTVVAKDATTTTLEPLFMVTLKEESTMEELYDRHSYSTRRPFPEMVVKSLLGSAEKEKKKKLENAPSFKAAKTYKGNEQIAEIVPLQRDFPKGKLVGKVERMLSMLIRKSENDMQGTRMVPYTRGLKGRLYTMITSAFLTFGFAIPITYPAAVKYEMPLEIHENGLEGLNGMSDKEVRKYRENCAAFVKPIGTVRVKKAGMGHFKLKKNENKDYDEWPKHTKRHFVFAMIAHVAMTNEFAKNGTYSIPDTTTTVEV